MRPLKVEELELVAGSGVGQDSADYNGYSGDDMDYDHGAMAQANAIFMSSYDSATNSYTVTDAFISAFQAAYPDTFHYEGSQPDAYTYQMVEDYAAHYGYGQVNFS